MLQQDWLMRQIQAFIQIIARLLFNKDAVEYRVTDSESPSETDHVHNELLRLIGQNRINEAENMLFDALETALEQDLKLLELAVDFYDRLNRLDDDTLETAGFSREEISEGLSCATKRFGLPDLS